MSIIAKGFGHADAVRGTQVRTPLLNMEVFGAGPRDASVVLLLHGWPDAPSTWDRVSPTLNAAGFRKVGPHAPKRRKAS